MLSALDAGAFLNLRDMTFVAQNAATLKDAKWLLTTGKNPYKNERGLTVKIKVLKKEGKELKIEIEGGTHGVCNFLQKRLLEDKTVDFAGYDVAHPLAASPTIYVRMKGAAKPEDALLRAVEKVRQANDAFSEELERVLKA